MKEIKNLIRIITLFSDNKFPIYNFNDLKESKKEEALLVNIMQDKYKDDKDASHDLYKGEIDSSAKYRMLKSRLRKKLFNHLFFLNTDFKASVKEEKKCLAIVLQAKILMLVGEQKLSEKLLNQAVVLAEKYEFTEIITDSLKNLILLYPQTKEHKKYYETLKKLNYYLPKRNAEEKAQEMYFTSKTELSKSVISKKQFLNGIPDYLIELRNLWTISGTYNSFRYYYMLNLYYLELQGDFKEIIRYLKEVLELLAKNKINKHRFDERHYGFTLVYAHLRSKEYEEGLQLAKRYLTIFNPYSNNWFAFLSHYFLLAMHAGNYQLAADLIFEVDNNLYFNKLNKRTKEYWSLYKAYLYFVNPRVSSLKKFSYQEFISTLPEHSKDKLGHNVAIHILQYIYHLKNGDYDQLYYKEGALRKYLNTYLKDTGSQRSRCFFRLLILSIRSEFLVEKIREKEVKWLDKLKAAQTPGDAFAEIEIIPYEKLWEIILDLIKGKKLSDG